MGQALQFGVLWAIGGALIFARGFLASVLFPGEYSAPIAALIFLFDKRTFKLGPEELMPEHQKAKAEAFARVNSLVSSMSEDQYGISP